MFPSPEMPDLLMQNLIRIVKMADSYGENGVWVKGREVKISFSGTILPITSKELKFDEAGTYTHDMVKLYTYEILGASSEILDDMDKRYRIFKTVEFSRYANGLNIYVLEKVGETVA